MQRSEVKLLYDSGQYQQNRVSVGFCQSIDFLSSVPDFFSMFRKENGIPTELIKLQCYENNDVVNGVLGGTIDLGFILSDIMDFSAYAEQVTGSVVSHVEALTASSGRPLVYLPSSKTSKEQKAREILAASPVEEGLICTLAAVEYCSTLQPVKQQDGKLALQNVNRKCKYYYFYFQDMEFGFMHVKLQTWFPFQIQVYINGRELMKHVFDENRITYSMYDNSFTEISDIEKAQELVDRFDSRKLCRQLDHFAYRLNPYLNTITDSFGQGYLWCVDQCEYATDVFSFLGRKLSNKFQGEAVSDYRKRPEGWRVKHRMKSNSIKMYDKSNCLRIEMTINAPKEFKVYKEVRQNYGE